MNIPTPKQRITTKEILTDAKRSIGHELLWVQGEMESGSEETYIRRNLLSAIVTAGDCCINDKMNPAIDYSTIDYSGQPHKITGVDNAIKHVVSIIKSTCSDQFKSKIMDYEGIPSTNKLTALDWILYFNDYNNYSTVMSLLENAIEKTGDSQ